MAGVNVLDKSGAVLKPMDGCCCLLSISTGARAYQEGREQQGAGLEARGIIT